VPRKGHVTDKQQRNLVKWQPGQSGNPAGRRPGSRNKLVGDFFRDLCESWEALGKPALLAMAWQSPAEYVRVVASLMPKEAHTTITRVNVERVSDAELIGIINHQESSSPGVAEPLPDAETLQ